MRPLVLPMVDGSAGAGFCFGENMETAGGESLDMIALAYGTVRHWLETDAQIRARLECGVKVEWAYDHDKALAYKVVYHSPEAARGVDPMGRCEVCGRWRERTPTWLGHWVCGDCK